MPEQILPIFCDGVIEINSTLSFKRENDMIYYFHGAFPIFSHAEDDNRSFRLFTSQLIDNGTCRNIDIQKAFGVSKVSVCRNLSRLRQGGSASFFKEKATRSSTVMTPKIIEEAQKLLDQGLSRLDVSEELGIKKDTLSKAIQKGKIKELSKKKH